MAGLRSARWAALALVLAACGGGGGGGATTLHTPEQLATVLLAPADVGTGWTQQDRQVPSAAPTTVPGVTTTTPASSFCPAAAEAMKGFEAVMTDEMLTMVVLGSPTATNDRPAGMVERLWSADKAASLFAQAKAALPNCIGQTWTVPSGEKVTMTAIEGLPKVGDESVSFLEIAAETTQSGDVEWYMPTTVARFGDVIAVLSGLDIHNVGTAPTLTTAQISPIFTTAAKKIESLHS